MISLDNETKREHFLQLMAQDRAPYFWAGGQLSQDKRLLRWESGRLEQIVKGRHPWSFAGSRGPQPDGNLGTEHCLAVLNNVYQVIMIKLRILRSFDFDSRMG